MYTFDSQIAKDRRKEEWNRVVDQLETSLRQLNQLHSDKQYPEQFMKLRGRINRYSDGNDYQAITHEIGKIKSAVRQYEQEKSAKAISLDAFASAPQPPAITQTPTPTEAIPSYLRENKTNTCCSLFFKHRENKNKNKSINARDPHIAKPNP